MPSSKNAPSSGLKKLAYVSGVISGGVVGVDYATWMDVSPAIGGVLGVIISLAITTFLVHVGTDPDSKIKKAFMQIGAFIGAILGIYAGMKTGDGASAFFGGLIGGSILGVLAGQIVAGLLSLAAILLLLMSRGPIGFFLREVMLGGV